MGTRKAQIVAVYLDEALQCLYVINANDPRPERAVALWSYDQRPAKKLVQQTEIHRKTAYLRERSPCPHVLEICRFHLENKS